MVSMSLRFTGYGVRRVVCVVAGLDGRDMHSCVIAVGGRSGCVFNIAMLQSVFAPNTTQGLKQMFYLLYQSPL